MFCCCKVLQQYPIQCVKVMKTNELRQVKRSTWTPNYKNQMHHTWIGENITNTIGCWSSPQPCSSCKFQALMHIFPCPWRQSVLIVMSNTYGEVTKLRQVRAEAENEIHRSPANTLVWIMNLGWLQMQQEEQLPLSQSIKNKRVQEVTFSKGARFVALKVFHSSPRILLICRYI